MQRYESNTMSEAEKYYVGGNVETSFTKYFIFTIIVSQRLILTISLYIMWLPNLAKMKRNDGDDINLSHADPATC